MSKNGTVSPGFPCHLCGRLFEAHELKPCIDCDEPTCPECYLPNKRPPFDRIWLQWFEHAYDVYDAAYKLADGVTWSQDRISKSDPIYLLATPARLKAEALIAACLDPGPELPFEALELAADIVALGKGQQATAAAAKLRKIVRIQRGALEDFNKKLRALKTVGGKKDDK